MSDISPTLLVQQRITLVKLFVVHLFDEVICQCTCSASALVQQIYKI